MPKFPTIDLGARVNNIHGSLVAEESTSEDNEMPQQEDMAVCDTVAGS